MVRRSRRRGNGRRVVAVENTVTQVAPVSVIPAQVDHQFTAAGEIRLPLPSATVGLPTKISSVNFQCASLDAVTWKLTLFGPNGPTRICRPFVTCGNTVSVKLRQSRGIDPVLIAEASQGLVLLSCSGAGSCVGTMNCVALGNDQKALGSN